MHFNSPISGPRLSISRLIRLQASSISYKTIIANYLDGNLKKHNACQYTNELVDELRYEEKKNLPNNSDS